MTDEALTLKQWFYKMQISERTARRLVAARAIDGLYRVGGQWRIMPPPAKSENDEHNKPASV